MCKSTRGEGRGLGLERGRKQQDTKRNETDLKELHVSYEYASIELSIVSSIGICIWQNITGKRNKRRGFENREREDQILKTCPTL